MAGSSRGEGRGQEAGTCRGRGAAPAMEGLWEGGPRSQQQRAENWRRQGRKGRTRREAGPGGAPEKRLENQEGGGEKSGGGRGKHRRRAGTGRKTALADLGNGVSLGPKEGVKW